MMEESREIFNTGPLRGRRYRITLTKASFLRRTDVWIPNIGAAWEDTRGFVGFWGGGRLPFRPPTFDALARLMRRAIYSFLFY